MKKIHLLLGILLLLIFLCLCMNIESFGNPFDKPFMQQKNNTDFKNESICRDDMTWKNKEKTCKDYSITGSDCSDIGDNGVVAFDACRVACDNCPKSVEIKIRQPSPSADYAEPPYSTFEGPQGEFMSEGGSVDYREIFTKLGEIEEKIETTSSDRLGLSQIEDALARQTHILSPKHWPKHCHEYTRPPGEEGGCPTDNDKCIYVDNANLDNGEYSCVSNIISGGVNSGGAGLSLANKELFDTCAGRMDANSLKGKEGYPGTDTDANILCSQINPVDLSDNLDEGTIGGSTFGGISIDLDEMDVMTCELFRENEATGGYSCATPATFDGNNYSCIRGPKCMRSFIYDENQHDGDLVNVCQLQGLIQENDPGIMLDEDDNGACEEINMKKAREKYGNSITCNNFQSSAESGDEFPCMNDTKDTNTLGDAAPDDVDDIRCIRVRDNKLCNEENYDYRCQTYPAAQENTLFSNQFSCYQPKNL